MSMNFHRGYNSARIKSLPTYAQAKAHYESVVPIRGSDNIRPLGANRRYKYTQIVKRMISVETPDNPLGEWAEVYACNLWGTDYITFYPNGDLVIDTKYRGRGYIQLTGKSNYTNFAKFIGEDTVGNPDLVATKHPLASAAG